MERECEDCGDAYEPWTAAKRHVGLCPACAEQYDCDAGIGEDYDDELIDGVGFADPGGRSALRAATASNPRNLPCPNCGQPDRLTPADRARGYQCDACADALERGGY